MAKRRRRKKRNGFVRFMVWYVLIFLLISAAGLYFLWNYMEAYEGSLPTGVISQYESEEMTASFHGYLESYASDSATALQDGDAVLAFLQTKLDETQLTLRKDSTPSVDGTPMYIVRLGKQTVGRVYMRKNGTGPYSLGLQELQVDHTEWFIQDEYLRTFSVRVPEGTVVAVGGTRLTSANSQVEKTEYDVGNLTEGMDSVYQELYHFGYYGDPEVTVLNLEPNTYIMDCNDEERVYSVSIVSDPEIAEKLTPFAEQFVQDYISFTSNASSYAIAARHMIPGTALYKRIAGSVDGMRWVSGVTSRISDLSVDHFEPYGEGVLCEAHYKLTDTQGNVLDANMRMLIVRYMNTWRVYNIEMI